MKNPVIMLRLIAWAAVIWLFWFMMSCSKSNYEQTKIHIIVQEGEDYTTHNFAFFCYKEDYGRIHDTILTSNSAHFDIDQSKIFVGRIITWSYEKTGRVDSSYIAFGAEVNLIGPIEHRKYANVRQIISY